MRPIQRLEGRVFGRWTVLEQDFSRGYVPGGLWKCRCQCGIEKSIRTRMLTEGQSQSCGCLHRERVSVPNTWQRIHGEGQNRTAEYRAYAHMKNRCYNKKDKRYPEWGGRKIQVCKRWRDSYLNFLEDMGRKPSPKHSLHRINNDGDYTPENCIWASAKTQTRNRRGKKIRWIEIDGRPDSVNGHCRTNKWDAALVFYHLNKGKDPQWIADYLRHKEKFKPSR